MELKPNDLVRQSWSWRWAVVLWVHPNGAQALVLNDDGLEAWPTTDLRQGERCIGCGELDVIGSWVAENVCDRCSNYGCW